MHILKSLNSSGANEPIFPELVLAMSLRWLAGGSYIDIKDKYGMSKSSVYRLRDMFLDAVIDCKALQIRFPTTEAEICDAARRFQSRSSEEVMRGCIGAIDGILIKIKQPTLKETRNLCAFFSGHYQHMGLNVQAVVDSCLRFTFVCIAAPRSASDMTAIRRSSLLGLLQKLPPCFYAVGDATYMSTEHILVPHTGSNRDDPYKMPFDYFLSQLRIRIEQAFGLLTTKWGIF